MRGNPIVRLVVLVLVLAGSGLLVGVITRPATGAGPAAPPTGSGDPSPNPSEEADLTVQAYAEIQLSAPARSISLSAIGSPIPAFDLKPTGLTAEADFSLALRNGIPIKDMLVVEWENADQSNFLHLTIEPASLKTRALTLHFPPGEESTILDLAWTTAPSP